MAISITSAPADFAPVYSIQEYTLYDSANQAQAGFYYQIDVSIDGEVRTFKTLKDENNRATFDVQKVLQSFFTSDIGESQWTSGSFLQAHTDMTKTYAVRASSVWAAGSSVGSYTSKKVFNGVDLYNRTWDTSLYEFSTDSSGLFLTTYHGERDIHFNDYLRVYALTGKSFGIDSSFNGIVYTRYNLGGDVSTYIKEQSIGTSEIYILSLAADPSTINSLSAGFIDSSTLYYTVAESTGLSETLRVNIVPEDGRYRDYWRILYVGRYGQTEAYNFDLVPTNSIDISKVSYTNDRVERTYGTKVSDKYTVTSNWMCEEKSESLKELWHSPLTYLFQDSIYIPIILNETSKTILNRHNAKPINYTLSFSFAEEYSVQFQ
jgi:hypothetical protein